jgi:polyhydroxyalkanoate synthesis regulator phasin
MKITGWEKINGYTYKGFCIVNPIHNANEDTYFATILNLNHEHRPKWDMILSAYAVKGVITFRILDSVTQHLLAKAHLTKVNIETPQKFREQYEMLVDDILEEAQSYTKTGTTGPSQGIINQVQTAGTTLAYSSHSISNGLNNLSVMQQALNAMRELEEQLDELKKQYPM